MSLPACPICGKPADIKLKPFCSARCAQLDLNRWLKETYAILSGEAPANDFDPQENHEFSRD